MKKSIFVAVTAAAFSIVLAVTACAGLNSASGSWRYRMTVTVSTPEGDRVGSAVREVSVDNGGLSLPESQPSVRLKGEAVVVDLGNRGVLFALQKGGRLGADYGSDIPGYTFLPHQGWLSTKGIQRMSKLKAGPVELTPEWYPMLVRFRDLNDPKTVESVSKFKDCVSPESNGSKTFRCFDSSELERFFGKGVVLKSITIEMTTDDVISQQIEVWLPWLKNIKGYIDGKFAGGGPELSNILDKGDFIEGSLK